MMVTADRSLRRPCKVTGVWCIPSRLGKFSKATNLALAGRYAESPPTRQDSKG